MKVIVVGCGRVGSTIARQLSDRGHEVVVVDRRAEAFNRLGEGFRGSTVVGIGFDRAVLDEAGVSPECAVIAVTNGDNSNILIARVARELFSVQRVVARIYDPRRAAIYSRLGIPTVASVTWASQRIQSLILRGEEGSQWSDPSNRYSIVERQADEDSAGRSVAELDFGDSRVLLVTRHGETSMPDPKLIIQDGDVLHVLGPNNEGGDAGVNSASLGGHA